MLRPTALFAALLAVSGCDAFSSGPDSLAEARALWAEAGAEDYVVEQHYEFVCHACSGGSRLEFATVTVRDGEVVLVVDADGAVLFDIDAGPPSYVPVALSVEDAFEAIEHAERYPDSWDGRVRVDYDAETGYPTRIDLGEEDSGYYTRARLRELRAF